MVIFNELRITENGKCIIVDCEVENVDVYSDMYIQSIYLEYYKNATSASMPSSKAYLLYENKDGDTSVKGKRLTFQKELLPATEFGISGFEGGLFYVIVNCDGTLPASISSMPCGYDSTTDVGAILDWKTFYSRGMSYVSSITAGCSKPNFCDNPVAFEEFLLLWNALKLALSTCNWDMVSELWDRFLRVSVGGTSSTVVSGGCGCR